MNSVLCGLAANPALLPDLVDRLIMVADEDVAVSLAEREDLTRAQAVALVSRVEQSAGRLAERGLLTADDVDPVAQPLAALALLAEGAGRPAWARLLAADPITERRERLAACPGLPAEVQEILAVDTEIGVIAEIALQATADMPARLAAHPHAEVRCAVASNEAAPPAVLAALVAGEGLPPARRCLVCDREETPFTHDPECPRLDCDLPPGAACDGFHESTVHQTHVNALWNPATPTAAVVGFAGHPSMLLRWPLAVRPDLPAVVYERLAASPEPGVRAALAANPAIGDDLIRALAADPAPDVRRSLASNPQVPLEVLTRLADDIKIGSTLLPRIATASRAEIGELAASPHPVVRMLLAERRDLPPEIRDALAADLDAKVVKSIAPHPGLSDARLRAMVERHGVRVVAKVAKNPEASPALLEDLARHEPPVRKALREIARHRNATAPALLVCLSDWQARPLAAGHPALPPQVIVELLTDDDWQVVEAAASNPALPPEVMSMLAP
ncbi:hypothetical protein Pve01_46540 [Planomonospora venezuelensis]|uniref:Leucine rich repeat variant n=1 Tax=Planomonospora venezuelensis TaxID=1999 RepID=A0A841DE98_PLAVE|nr:hypothetical protein [Planomonospora venezuelensis]GIN02996.1 hypothetical protein Pve01_46540 [Planomonospora venezuelensis]